MKRLVKKAIIEIESLEKKEIIYAFFMDLETFINNLTENDYDFVYETSCVHDGNENYQNNDIVNYYLNNFDLNRFREVLNSEIYDELENSETDEDYIRNTIKHYYNYTNKTPYSHISYELEEKYEEICE